MNRILLVFGTRPEAIKMAPVFHELKKRSGAFDVQVCVTGQHREMLDQVLEVFDIRPEHDLALMRTNQDLSSLSASVLTSLKPVLEKFNPNAVLVHGDTTTSLMAALAAFYQKIPVGHVEAGLRTRNLLSPWPEEANRQLTSRLARFHFAPTEESRRNLQSENLPQSKICVTGNTVIDALLYMVEKLKTQPEFSSQVRRETDQAAGRKLGDRPFILVTGHRRENFGEAMAAMCRGLEGIAARHPELDVVYPVHLNPNVQEPVHRILGSRENVILTRPLRYEGFVDLMSRCELIITDSGGVQEEAPSLGKPVILTRDTTERPEAIELGLVRMVGCDTALIVSSAEEALTRVRRGDAPPAANPYGDGKAARRIADFLAAELGQES
jgi:UDP-N-acetylglucosamine 2-epimerase (non-hydrolysing)